MSEWTYTNSLIVPPKSNYYSQSGIVKLLHVNRRVLGYNVEDVWHLKRLSHQFSLWIAANN